MRQLPAHASIPSSCARAPSLAPPHARVRVWAARRPAAAAAAAAVDANPQPKACGNRCQRIACRSDVRAPAAPSYRGCADTPLPAPDKTHIQTARVSVRNTGSKRTTHAKDALEGNDRSSDRTERMRARAPPSRARPAHRAGSNGAPPSSGRRKPRVRACVAWHGVACGRERTTQKGAKEAHVAAQAGRDGSALRACCRARRRACGAPHLLLPSLRLFCAQRAGGRRAGARQAAARTHAKRPTQPVQSAESERRTCVRECVPAPPTA
jgi:hypothetical protein